MSVIQVDNVNQHSFPAESITPMDYWYITVENILAPTLDGFPVHLSHNPLILLVHWLHSSSPLSTWNFTGSIEEKTLPPLAPTIKAVGKSCPNSIYHLKTMYFSNLWKHVGSRACWHEPFHSHWLLMHWQYLHLFVHIQPPSWLMSAPILIHIYDESDPKDSLPFIHQRR